MSSVSTSDVKSRVGAVVVHEEMDQVDEHLLPDDLVAVHRGDVVDLGLVLFDPDVRLVISIIHSSRPWTDFPSETRRVIDGFAAAIACSSVVSVSYVW